MTACPTGIMVLDKPRGMSSMAAVVAVRRRLGLASRKAAKVGHAGTLDPLATGVLVMAIGKATRAISQLMDTTKRYRTTIDLTAFTTTDDLEGERSEVAVSSEPTQESIHAALRSLTGTIMQRPPAFSAMKVGGKRAYRMARAGEIVELQPRPVVVHSIELLRYAWPQVEIAIHCGKGTYVRSIARDLGLLLGTGGHCITLRRTAVGPFTETEAITVDALPELITETHLMSVQHALERVRGE